MRRLYRLCKWLLIILLGMLVFGPQFADYLATLRPWILLALVVIGTLVVWAWRDRRKIRRRGHVRQSAAERLWHTNRLDEAQHAFAEALELYQQASHLIGQANALNGLGDVELQLQHYDAARNFYTQALTLYKRTVNRLGQADVLCGLGDVEWQKQHYDAARDFYTQALNLYTPLGNRLGLARAFRSLGNVACVLNEVEPAHNFYTQVLNLSAQMDDYLGQADCLMHLGQLSRNTDSQGAQQCFSRAAELYRDHGRQEQAMAAAQAAQECDSRHAPEDLGRSP
jgi:tetratricopeptide (TPR) repeat protein